MNKKCVIYTTLIFPVTETEAFHGQLIIYLIYNWLSCVLFIYVQYTTQFKLAMSSFNTATLTFPL